MEQRDSEDHFLAKEQGNIRALLLADNSSMPIKQLLEKATILTIGGRKPALLLFEPARFLLAGKAKGQKWRKYLLILIVVHYYTTLTVEGIDGHEQDAVKDI